MQRDLVIVGTGGHAREIAAAVQAQRAAGSPAGYSLIGFLDDAPQSDSAKLGDTYGASVLGTTEWLTAQPQAADVMLGIGVSRVRAAVAGRLERLGVNFASVIHPTAIVSRSARFGVGFYAAANAVITEAVCGGEHVHVNVSATVSHDCRLGSFVTLAPGSHVAGNVNLGTGAEVGIGSCIVQGISVGEWSVLGAGAAAVRDVEPRVTSVGVPARLLRPTTE